MQMNTTEKNILLLNINYFSTFHKNVYLKNNYLCLINQETQPQFSISYYKHI